MAKVSLIAKLTAADGKEAELEAAITTVVAASAEEEGLEVYSAYRSNDEPGVFYFFELYRDDDAWALHGKGEGMRKAMGGFNGLLAGKSELTMMTPLVAKGLDF